MIRATAQASAPVTVFLVIFFLKFKTQLLQTQRWSRECSEKKQKHKRKQVKAKLEINMQAADKSRVKSRAEGVCL